MNTLPNAELNIYTTVKKEVEEVFGRSILTSGDCNLLCIEIYNKTGSTLNQNTLRRFFGLVKAKYLASNATLNIMAKYCGYNSLDEIRLADRQSINAPALQEEDWSVHFYLVNLFREMQARDEDDDTFFTFIGHTINFLQKKPELIQKFQRAIAKTASGRKYYFEHFINLDKLNSFYGTGLRYYINENKDAEGRLFGYSLLCVRDWLINDHVALRKNYEYLQQQYLSSSTPIFIYSWYFAARLLYADVYEPSAERILVEAYNRHVVNKSLKDTYYLYNCFEYPLSFALILTHHYEEALFYINYAFLNYKHKAGHISQGCYEHLLLLKAIALININERKQAAELFEQLYPSQFYLTSKRLNTLLYLILAAYLKKITTKQYKQYAEIVSDTGFEKLAVMFDDVVSNK